MSPKPTPSSSRAASPATGAPNSRAASPAAAAALPTKEAVLAQIPVGGISIKALTTLFKTKAMSKDVQTAFIKLVKEVARTEKETGLLKRR